MKYYDLGREEKQILADLENNHLRSVKNVARLKRVISLASSILHQSVEIQANKL